MNANPKCNPCNPGYEEFDPDTDHKKHDTIDVAKDFLADFEAVGDEFIHQSKVDGILRAALGLDFAADIEDHILKPILDAQVGSLIPVAKIAEVIASLNAEDEDIEVEDDLPAVEEIVKLEEEDEKAAEEGVTFHTGIVSDPSKFDNATVETLDTGNGEVIMITIPEGDIEVTEVEEVPVDEIGDIAEDAANDIVDSLANDEHLVIDEPEPVIEVLPAPDEVEPEVLYAPKLHVCGPHTIGDKWYDFSDLGTEAAEGYYSRVFDETDGAPAEGWLQWNYCAPFEEGRFARYYRKKYGNMEYDQTIADTDYIEHVSAVDGGVRFEMETS